MPDRVVDQLTPAQPVEHPEHRGLLELPERERRAHPRDLGLLAGAPPSSGHAEVSHLVVGRRALADRIEQQDEASDRGGRDQNHPDEGGPGRRRLSRQGGRPTHGLLILRHPAADTRCTTIPASWLCFRS